MSQPNGSEGTEGNEAPEGAGNEGVENEGAQGSGTENGSSSEEKDWKAEAEKWKSFARKHETELTKAQKAIKAIEDKEKSEAQRLAEQLAEREVELETLKVGAVRREAAEATGLPANFIKFISGATPEEALEQAKELAKALNVAAGNSNEGQQQAPPPTDFRQGARRDGSKPRTQTPDDIIRAMAGL